MTLLPKLPSKLSTIITANEEDLRPSLLRPRCNVLSPSEWSKLLLTKVLAQTVFDTYQCIEHAETLAMAHAETGNYDQAMQWQKKAIAVATSANRADAMPCLKKNLALYESGKPCRTPW